MKTSSFCTNKLAQLFLKSFLLIFVFSCFLQNTIAQNFWEKVLFPDTLKIASINFYEDKILVGTSENQSYGSLFVSDNEIYNWEFLWDTGDHTVAAIEVSEIGNIFIVKSSIEKMQYSDDGGENWNTMLLPDNIDYGVTHFEVFEENALYLGLTYVDGGILVRTYDNGISWDSLFSTQGHSNEYISDILLTNTNEIYISMGFYTPNPGGVYRSIDNGENWEFIGLNNCSVSALAINSEGDLFASVDKDNSSGVYVLKAATQNWDCLISGTPINHLILNSADHIFCSTYTGIFRSTNNGVSFESINEGLGGGWMGDMLIDSEDFIYARTLNSTSSLYKSIKNTVTLEEFLTKETQCDFNIYPNPFQDKLFIDSNIQNSLDITIYNSIGNVVFHKKIMQPNFEIITNFLEPGVYFVKLKKKHLSQVMKTIKY